MKDQYTSLKKTIAFLHKKTKKFKPSVALVLGSGLGGITKKIKIIHRIKYTQIPNFPKVKSIKGQSGELIFGEISNKKIVLMSGRFHAYQGISLLEATFPIRVLHALGADKLIITNAAGGLNKKFKVGDLMILEDHVNAMATTPLIGVADERLGPQFVPMTEAYNKKLISLTQKTARKLKIKLQKGVYIAVSGPTYETRAEVRMYRTFADAIGMSTVPEVIVANQIGLKVLGISCITNVHNEKSVPSHEEVIKAGKAAETKFENLVQGIIKVM